MIDSRESKEGDVIRRRRECLKCERRFTTYERSDEIPYMVVKRDGRREKFDRQKVLEGLLKACEKGRSRWRSWPKWWMRWNRSSPTRRTGRWRRRKSGELLMKRLVALDKIAYVRFASVYRDFQDVEAFLAELKDLLQKRV